MHGGAGGSGSVGHSGGHSATYSGGYGHHSGGTTASSTYYGGSTRRSNYFFRGDDYAHDPTPEERGELRRGFVDWRAVVTGKAWSVRRYVVIITFLTICIVAFILFEVFHKTIIKALTPAANHIRDLKAGWLIPIAIMFVLSFPPLFGNEIVHILVGIVWGLGIGFGIVCAGTLIGEIANFFLFKYACQARAEKIERRNLAYATLARVIKDGGFLFALIVRLSSVPTHISTAIFATGGMSFLSFVIGAILALPKQLALVWFGVVFFQQDQHKNNRQRVVNFVIFFGFFVMTIASLHYVMRRMRSAKLTVLRDMRASGYDPATGEYLAPPPGFVSKAPISSRFLGRS